MSRDPTRIWCFAVVVVRQADRFLLIQERKHGQLWYLPAGRVEPGETFFAAACREAVEEAGFAVRLTGVVRIEHSVVSGNAARLRVIFEAVPTVPVEAPAGGPDALAAAWVTAAEARTMPLRDPALPQLFRHLAEGGPIVPLGILTTEDAPFPPVAGDGGREQTP